MKTNTKVARYIIDSHLKGNNTSLIDIFETKCCENRKDWRHCFLTQLTGLLEKIIELAPGEWWAGEQVLFYLIRRPFREAVWSPRKGR